MIHYWRRRLHPDDIDTTSSGVLFDLTPSVLDTQFFVETQLKARDNTTACLWQANEPLTASIFQKAFAKMQIVGPDASKLVDGSEVILQPPSLSSSAAKVFFPPGLSLILKDVEQTCATPPFPNLLTKSGTPETAPSMTLPPKARVMTTERAASLISRNLPTHKTFFDECIWPALHKIPLRPEFQTETSSTLVENLDFYRLKFSKSKYIQEPSRSTSPWCRPGGPTLKDTAPDAKGFNFQELPNCCGTF
ncbi:hypothetical protein C8F04DRAFT_1289209 [Mycena alexandri]|uniref:Fungal ligninase C-terminal domain-containing protein n=1 Tax=Mycena alexandri TaxID=1745969 RepID=A0AAD6SLL3_9AGAR|nr:hypothetical protein C8F04DRAFT_1289209 [Mycena alexandri]